MKKIFAILLIVAFVFGMVLVFASCGGSNNQETNTDTETTNNSDQTNVESSTATDSTTETNTETNTETENEDEVVYYTVIVEDQFAQPIEGVQLQICNDQFCLPVDITDADGVVKYEFDTLESFKVQINEVPEGYVMPTEKIPFPDGKSLVTVTIKRLETYEIMAVDLHGRPISNILVELVGETGAVVDSFVTEKSGIATFIVEPGKYTAKVKNNDGNTAFVPVGGEDISFENGKDVKVWFNISTSEIDYIFTVKNKDGAAQADVNVLLYDEDLNLVKEGKTDANGKVTFKTPNGTYFAVVDSKSGLASDIVELSKNGKTTAELVAVGSAGASRDSAIFLPSSFDITATKDGVWYVIPDSNGKIIEIESSTVSILYNGKTVNPVDGKLTVELKSGAKIKISTSNEGGEQISGKVYRPGSKATPYEIEASAEQSLKVSLANGTVYYSFVADKNGTVRASTETDYAYVLINGNPFKKSVNAGETVVFCFTTKDENGDLVADVTEIDAKISFAETKADYKVEVLLENEISPNASIELYKYENDAYVLVEAVTCDANGAYTFTQLTETANYYVKAICNDGYETQKEYLAFNDETELKVHINHKRDGSREYPFLVNGDELSSSTTEITATSAGTYYTIFYVYGATISIDNANVKVEVIVGGQTVEILTGNVLSFLLNETNMGTNSRVLLLVSSASGNDEAVNLVIVAPEIPKE